MRIRGVDVYVHWTVFLIAAVMRPTRSAGSVDFGRDERLAGLILIHECGHLIAAQWRHARY